MRNLPLKLLLLLLALTSFHARAEDIIEVNLCELPKAPGNFNHKLIKVTGVVSQGFEDFTLSDAACHSKRNIWLEYGGTQKSGTMYCCGVSATRSRPQPLIVEGIPTSINVDRQFRQFDEQIRHGERPRATLIGRFFSGKETAMPGGVFWVGFGHFGLYSLLVIQDVLVSQTPETEKGHIGGRMKPQPEADRGTPSVRWSLVDAEIEQYSGRAKNERMFICVA